MHSNFYTYVPGLDTSTQCINRWRIPNREFRFPHASPGSTILRCLALLLLSTGGTFAQQDDPQLRARFLRGIAEAGETIQRLSFRASCVDTSRFTSVSAQMASEFAKRNEDPLKESTRDFQCSIRGSATLMTGSAKSGNIYFKVRNNAYAFALQRTSAGKRTSLEFVEQLGVDPAIDAQVLRIEENVRGNVLGGYYLWRNPLFLLFEERNSFKIHRVYRVDSGGAELVRVEFDGVDFDGPVDHSSPSPQTTYLQAFLICDPSKAWVLTEYGGKLQNHKNNEESIHHVAVELGSSIHGIPFAKRIQRDVSFPAHPENVRRSVSTIEINNQDVPEAEFRLSYYGLPEPNFRQKTPEPWVWYLVGALIFISIGGILLRRSYSRIKAS